MDRFPTPCVSVFSLSVLGFTLLASNPALAGGFQLREQSAIATGTALAGSQANANGPSLLAYNPAVTGNLDGTQASATAIAIFPETDIDNIRASYTGGAPTVNGPSTAYSDEDAYPFALGVSHRLDDHWGVGLAVYVPFGLATKYDEDWRGRFHAVETDLATYNINPSVAYSFNDRVTVAAGAQIVYADSTLSNKVDYGFVASSQGVPGAPPPGAGAEGLAELNGDDWGYGFNLGLLVQATEDTRIGASVRSQVDLTLSGDAEFGADNPSAAATRNALRAGGNVFTDGGGASDLSLPGIVAVGVYHEATERLALMGTLEWTNWSKFDQLVVRFNDNTPDSVTNNDWDNTFMLSAGARYQLSNRWKLRGGLAYDETPIPGESNRTPRIPGTDRTWLSLGLGYEPTSHLALNASYTHFLADEAGIDQAATPTNENAARGSLRADTDSGVDFFTVQASYRF